MLWPSFCTFSPGPLSAPVEAGAPVAQKWTRTSTSTSATATTPTRMAMG